jgi:hypothetical protein
MTIIFQSPELEKQFNEKVKEMKGLIVKQKQTDSPKEKVIINKRIEELRLEIEELKKQGSPTGKNIQEAGKKQK